MKQYICIAGPKEISVEKGHKDEAFKTFQAIINEYASKGWTYHSMENLTVSEKQGCMSSPIVVNHYMLIFERDEYTDNSQSLYTDTWKR